MNKLFTKIVGAALGATMAIGVGVAVASNTDVARADAAGDTTISWTATSGALGSAISKKGGTATGSITLAPTSGTSYTMSYTRTLVALATNKSDNVSWQGSTWIQLGSNNASQSVVFTASSIPGTIKSVSIQAATAGTHTYTIDVGGTKYANALALSTYSGTAAADNPTPADTTKTATGTSSGALTITLTAGTRKALVIRSISVTYNNDAPAKSLSSIALSGSYPTTFTQGDTFSHSGMIVTATYSDSTTADVTSKATWSSPDMSTAGQKTVTVSYTEGETTKTETYSITVNAPKTVSNFELLGGLSSGDTITVEAQSTDTSVTGEAVYYLLKFSDNTYGAATLSWDSTDGLSNVDHYTNEQTGDDDGGYVEPTFTKNGVFTLTLSYAAETPLEIKWKVKGLPTISYIDDTLTPANISNPSSYSAWSGKTKTFLGINSEASYSGYSTGGTEKFQMRDGNNQSGIYTTQSGGKINKVSVVWHSDQETSRSLIIYGSNSAFESISDITSGTEVGSIDFSDSETEYTLSSTQNFAYVAVYASGGGALYLSSITFTWAVEEAPTDTLKSIEISGDLSKTTYYAGQTILTNGLTVTATFEDDEEQTYTSDVSAEAIWTISYPTAKAEDEGKTKDVTFEASFTSGSTTKTDSVVKTISVNADSVTGLSWGNRGTVDVFSGTTLGDAVDTSKWTFTPTWASGKSDSPSWGTGTHDVHIVLSDVGGPTSEAGLTPLTSSYAFQSTDNGKYIVAFYEGKASTNNSTVSVTKWRHVWESSTLSEAFDYSAGGGNMEQSGDIATASIAKSGSTTDEADSLRLGSGSKTGSLTVTSATNLISKIEVWVMSYGSDSATLNVGSENTGTISADEFERFEFTFDEPVSSVAMSTTAGKKRVYVQKVVITSGGLNDIGKSADCLGLEVFIDKYLHMDDYPGTEGQAGPGWCKDNEHNYYGKNTETGAKYHFNQLNAHQKSLFTTNSAYTAEWARLKAWAEANGDSLNTSTNVLESTSVNPIMGLAQNGSTVAIIIVVSAITLTSIGGYFFIRRRKHN